MPRIYLVRHGKAAASFTDDLDPGLDALGRTQAEMAASTLINNTPLNLVSSPLRRARETAEPLAARLNQKVLIEERIAEIPSPGLDLAERGAWLQNIMKGRVSDFTPELTDWRQQMIDCLLEIQEDTVIFSHFVAINLLVGAAEDREEVLVFRPDNGSITVFESNTRHLRLVERGSEAGTRIN